MNKKMRVGILTGGGDCPGLNAVIRAVAKKLMIENNAEIIGIKDGYEGLISNQYRMLGYSDVSGILTLGGTILGTSNIANPYRVVQIKNGKTIITDKSKQVLANIKRQKMDCLVCIGGDGTMAIASRLSNDGVPLVGVPKTIDNDIRGTDVTFGFDTAVSIATEGIDRLHTTAQSHHRIMILELMGRTAGWISLHAGIAGGGDIILIPEIPYDIQKVAQVVKARNKRGSKFSIIVIGEGARPKGGKVVVQRMVQESTIAARLGGISNVLSQDLEQITGLSTRAVVMGHLIRGGSPTANDRVLATQLGVQVADLINKKQFGTMVGVSGCSFKAVKLKDVAQGPKLVSKNHPLVKAARSVGTSFGD
ncbi:MAG: ATP-dependent 6-phosphofructokinase [Candidatus Omnitrophica bacterium]|nr:ATP-dependent 6-phosphofructokinase [Candidatus Omnitrophota bacterium]